MIALLLRLYPARWRHRYGDEFAALLQERPLGPFDVTDVLLGALDAHLHLRGLGAASEHRKGFTMSLRIGGYAAVLGGILWFSALAVTSAVQDAGAVGMLALGLGSAALLVALVGLSAFQARRYPWLTWAAFIIPALGACASIVGVIAMAMIGDEPFIGDLSPWYVWSFGTLTLIIGSGLFAIATWRARALARPAAAFLAIGSLFVAPLILGLTGSLVGDLLPESLAPFAIAAGALTFAGGWIALGLSALRIDGPRPSTLEGAA